MGVHMHALSVEAGSQCWVSHSVTLCHIVLAWDLSPNWWCGNSASLAAGNCTRVLTLVWQTLYWLSHLPSPKICILILVFFLCSPSQYLCLCCVCDRLLLVTRSWEDKQKGAGKGKMTGRSSVTALLTGKRSHSRLEWEFSLLHHTANSW